MTFRVTPQLSILQALRNAQSHTANLARLQQQVSSGLRIHKPSEDPLGTRRVIAQKNQIAQIDTELANISVARSSLNLSVSQLVDAKQVFVRAKEVALLSRQSGERETLAREIDSLIEHLVSIGNTQSDGQSLYGGTSARSAPFTVTRENGRITAVTYVGADGPASVSVGLDDPLATHYAGSDVFLQRGRGETVFIGDTGAASGAGTDSAVGQSTLTVRHTSTSYGPGSGVQPGASSAGGDTILGPAGAHILTITDTSGNGSAGTVSLNGGPALEFTNTDTDLRVTGPTGETVFVDTTSIASGFAGDIAITADGTLSTDGGLTEIPIDFSSNQVVTNSETGRVTNVDATAIRRAGVEQVEYGETADAFRVLIELRDELLDARGLTEDEWNAALSRRLGDVDRTVDSLLDVVGEQSVALESLDSLEDGLREVQLHAQEVLAEVESADLSKVVLDLQAEQNLLQFTFATSTTLLDNSLLDFLR